MRVELSLTQYITVPNHSKIVDEQQEDRSAKYNLKTGGRGLFGGILDFHCRISFLLIFFSYLLHSLHSSYVEGYSICSCYLANLYPITQVQVRDAVSFNHPTQCFSQLTVPVPRGRKDRGRPRTLFFATRRSPHHSRPWYPRNCKAKILQNARHPIYLTVASLRKPRKIALTLKRPPH